MMPIIWQQRTRWSLAALVLVLVIGTLLDAPARISLAPVAIMAGLKLLPLLPFLFWLPRGSAMAFIWLGIVLLGYLLMAGLSLATPGQQWWGALELLAVGTVLACIFQSLRKPRAS